MDKKMLKIVSFLVASVTVVSMQSCIRAKKDGDYSTKENAQISQQTTFNEDSGKESEKTKVTSTKKEDSKKPEPNELDRTVNVKIGNFTQQSVCKKPNGFSYRGFMGVAEEELITPALNQDFIPQGTDIWEEKNMIVISGYFSSGKSPCSMLFAVDLESKKAVGYWNLKDTLGLNFAGHVGGVAISKNNLFLSAGKGKLFRYSLKNLEKSMNGNLKPDGTVSVPSNASFCNYADGTLFVGDFYLTGKYTTSSFAHMINRDGKEYGAIVCAYLLEDTEIEIKPTAFKPGSYTVPDFIFSIRDKIQGFTYDAKSNYIILSESYGRKNDSKIYFYNNPRKDEANHTKVEISGENVPVWFLDTKVKCKILNAFPMAEGICFSANKAYLIFESGSNKYRLDGAIFPSDAVWSIDTSLIKL